VADLSSPTPLLATRERDGDYFSRRDEPSLMTETTRATGPSAETTGDGPETTRQVWMVERTFSSDSPNILVVVYATPDGGRYLQQERAYNGFSRNAPVVTAAVTVPEERLAPVADPDLRDRYAEEAAWMADHHDPDDAV
jgi:hypothetical protein